MVSFRLSVPAALATFAQLQTGYAWGNLGHETVGYVAQSFLTTAAKSWAQGILGSTSSDYLASASTWADSYKYTSAGAFSKEWHYIDAKDDPPSSCGVEYDRDCPTTGCIVSAINNYTNQLLDSSTSKAEQLNALKFIIHFIGDIHQPLHDEELDVGGNSIDVTYDGDSTNLHHVWDTSIPEQDAGGSTISAASSYSATLVTAIKTGAYASKAASWISSDDVSEAQTSATNWATDANSYVCSIVLAKGISYVENNDLSGTYYTTAKPVVEELLARAGYRLANWLNKIAAQAA